MTQWLRWWHGAYSDPKLHAVALRAKVSRSEVVAIWAGILEHASQQANRGDVGDPGEEIAIALALEIEVIERVMAALKDKGLIVAQRIAAWEERQPQREDATATQRSKRFRSKGNAEQRTVARVADTDATHDPGDATHKSEDATHQNRAEQSRAEQKRVASKPAEPPGSDPALEGGDGALLWAGVDPCPPDGWARMLDELNSLAGSGLLSSFANELTSSLTSRGTRGAPMTAGQQAKLAQVYAEHQKHINEAGRRARKRRWPEYERVMITAHGRDLIAALGKRSELEVDRVMRTWAEQQPARGAA
jgi:hypothetical protein